jgi:hypothetical protein
MDRRALLTAIESGRARFEDALAAIPDTAMLDRVDDEWTRKDVVAHVEAWERRVIGLVEKLRAGETPGDEVETDELNARFYAADRDRALADVRSGEAAAYAAMLAEIGACTDEELFDGSHFGWTEGDPLADWFRSNGDEHYDEHLEQLTREARPARTGA